MSLATSILHFSACQIPFETPSTTPEAFLEFSFENPTLINLENGKVDLFNE